MLFQVAVLCDAATDHGGKLNLLGAFDTIAGASFPLIHPHCALALRIRFGPMEEGKHDLRITLIDGDGHTLLKPIDIPVGVTIGNHGYFASRNVVINLERLPFKAPGQYAVDLAVNGESQQTIPLQVIQVTPRRRSGSA